MNGADNLKSEVFEDGGIDELAGADVDNVDGGDVVDGEDDLGISDEVKDLSLRT